MPEWGNRFLPCTCYGVSTKVCSVGCGCPCHTTPDIQSKLAVIRAEFEDLIARTNRTGGLSDEDLQAIKELIPIAQAMRDLVAELGGADLFREMITWYKRIKDL